MTFAEMTPEKWAKVGVIALVIGTLWCGAWLWWSVRKVDKKESEAGDGPRDW